MCDEYLAPQTIPSAAVLTPGNKVVLSDSFNADLCPEGTGGDPDPRVWRGGKYSFIEPTSSAYQCNTHHQNDVCIKMSNSFNVLLIVRGQMKSKAVHSPHLLKLSLIHI